MSGISYVQLEFDKFLTDDDYRLMSLAEKGLYSYLIFDLYSKGGKLTFDADRYSRILTTPIPELVSVWDKIAFKFEIKGEFVSHKKVSEQIKKSRKRRKDARDAALIRHGLKDKDDATAMRGQCEGNARAMLGKVSISKSNLDKLTTIIKEVLNSDTLLSYLPNTSNPRLLEFGFTYLGKEAISEMYERISKGAIDERHAVGKFMKCLVTDLKKAIQAGAIPKEDSDLIIHMAGVRHKRGR